MEVMDEEFGGTLVVLGAGDTLDSVPKSHRQLITPGIQLWWADPKAAIRRVADENVTPKMSRWFRKLADEGDWQLELHSADHGETRAGFWWECPGVRGAEIGPPSGKALPEEFPVGLRDYYQFVGFVDWMGFGASGGLEGPGGHPALKAFNFPLCGDGVDPGDTFIFGWGPGGAMLIYTGAGRGGWVSPGSGKVHLLGSVLETVDWVYGELLADRCPDYDYSW